MKKILVVDDNKDTVTTMKMVLEKAGYAVSVAFNGQEGYERAQTVMPDAILLDMMMPIMDGYTMNQYLKRNPSTKDIPVIVISARGGMAPMFDVKNGTQVEDYMVKPVNSRALLMRIEELFKTVKS